MVVASMPSFKDTLTAEEIEAIAEYVADCSFSIGRIIKYKKSTSYS